MAIKNYMINDKWLDIAKQNIVEVESTDGVIGSVKVNGEEYGGGGGGSSDSITVTMSYTSDPDGLGMIVAKTTGLELAAVLPEPQEFELVGSGSALIFPFGMYQNVTGAEPYGGEGFLQVLDGATVVFS